MIPDQSPSTTLVVGLGSSHGDDQLGWRVVELLRESPGLRTRARAADDPAQILDWLDCLGALHVCDACRCGGSLGSVHRWTWPDLPPTSATRPWSGHAMSLSDTLSLANTLGMLPQRVTIWGLEVESFSPGDPLSKRAADSLPELVACLIAEIRRA